MKRENKIKSTVNDLNRYWNPRRDSLSHFTMFLIANPYAFTFTDN